MRSHWLNLSLIFVVAAGAYAQNRGQAERTVTTPKPQFDAEQINAASQADVKVGDKGSGVVRAQILLNRVHFSCGEIDGDFGTNLQKAVSAYQGERQLPVTGNVDSGTWASLNADSAPALMSYSITEEDEKGPFEPVPSDMMAQSKLAALGYASPLEELGERFHVSPALLKALNPSADFTKVGQALTVPNVLTMPPGQAAKVVVTKSESSVRAYDAGGKLLAFYSATIGSEHDPLPVGEWKILGQRRNPDFHYDAKLFWDSKHPAEKALIQPGPNNPVGVVWIDLSKAHYGIHGSPEPSMIGHTTSHGCIRLTNWDALELSAMIKPGTPASLKE